MENIIDLIGKCPTEACTGNVKYYNHFPSKQGLSCKLEFSYTDCSWSHSFCTIKKVSKASAAKTPCDVNNMCAIIALRENGKGYAGLESVCGYMNLVPPMNVNSFNKSMGDIISSYKQCAEDKMNSAAENVRQMNNEITVDNETIVDIVVSSDGTWQKRGHDSLNGVVTIIRNDVRQCIDYRVLSTKKCNACSKWETKKDAVEFEKFISEHECSINHRGSAGSVEAKGVVECFQLSVENRKLQYTKFIGDGDSKTHTSIFTADPYPGVKVEKLECMVTYKRELD